jgi:hypothetical protein
MKKRLALLFVAIMILSCMPVMAGTVSTDAAAADTAVTVQAAKSGWVKSGTTYMYYVNGKAYKNGIYTIAKKMYGFDTNGKLCKGWFKINGCTYYASVNLGAKGFGEVLTGYRKIGSKFYYLDPNKKGMRRCGFIRISGKLYFFSSIDFAQRTTKGWFNYGKNRYYVKADGTIATNTTIDGVKVGANGAAAADMYGMDKKAQGYDSSTRYLILVNKAKFSVNFYQGSKGHWVNIKRDIRCTIGKSSTPTKSGNFKIDIKSTRVYGYKDFGGSTAFYVTRINAGNFFHSIIYKLGCRNPYTHSPKDATLGKRKSNSCIRLPLEDAKFIYDKVPRYSRVIVY